RIEHHRGAGIGGQQAGGGAGDAALGCDVGGAAGLEVGLDLGGARRNGPAVDPHEQPLGGELVEVAAHRLGGDVEVDRELGDGHAAARLEQLEDAAPAFTGVHGAPASSEVGRG